MEEYIDKKKYYNDKMIDSFCDLILDGYKHYHRIVTLYSLDPSKPILGYKTGPVLDDYKKFFYERVNGASKEVNLVNKLRVKRSDTRLYRGINNLSINDYMRILKSSNHNVYRYGYYGDGMYFTMLETYAKMYTDEKGGVVEAKIPKDTKVIDRKDLLAVMKAFDEDVINSEKFQSLPKHIQAFARKNVMHVELASMYAGMFGYDGIKSADVYCMFKLDNVIFKDIKESKAKPEVRSHSI
ncbi:MAG: hypothetical protein IJ008_01180 [Clostridia bacterium]|nr:hypothetical protein [Clostridia bacterium]